MFCFVLTHEIYVIQLETNARNVEHIQSWVNNKRFNHMQHVALGALVMLIENIDLKVVLQMEPLES
jgi:cytochrome b